MGYDSYSDIIDRPRPVSGHRSRMTVAHRAKQFAPFAALKGFEEEIAQQEIVYERKKSLSEDQIAELRFRLRMLRYGTEISACYFAPDEAAHGLGHYITVTGKVRMVHPDVDLWIGGQQILLDDLYDIHGDQWDCIPV